MKIVYYGRDGPVKPTGFSRRRLGLAHSPEPDRPWDEHFVEFGISSLPGAFSSGHY